jgi:hypothetical protein
VDVVLARTEEALADGCERDAAVTEFPVLRGRGPGLLITGSVYDAHGNNEWILKLLELLKALWIKRPDVLMHLVQVDVVLARTEEALADGCERDAAVTEFPVTAHGRLGGT